MNTNTVSSTLSAAVIILTALILSSSVLAGSKKGFGPIPHKSGPYGVGYMTVNNLTVSDGTTTNLTIWYPINKKSKEPNRYHAVDDTIGGGSFSIPSPMNAVENAKIAKGKFAAIIDVHGGPEQRDFGRLLSTTLHEHLASHGLIAVGYNRGTGCNNLSRNVQSIIDYMAAGPLKRSIKKKRFGVRGFSAGGPAALGIAGGDDDPNSDGLLPDKRVKAIVLVEPSSDCTAEFNRNIKVPVLLYDGSYFGEYTDLFHDMAKAKPRYRVTIDRMSHISMSLSYCPMVKENRRLSLEQQSPPYYEPLLIPNDSNAAFAQFFWNVAEIFNFPELGGMRDYCNTAGVGDPILNLDDGTGVTSTPPYDTSLAGVFEDNNRLPEARLNRLVKSYDVSFWKVHLDRDYRYQRFLTKGFAKTLKDVKNLDMVRKRLNH